MKIILVIVNCTYYTVDYQTVYNFLSSKPEFEKRFEDMVRIRCEGSDP